MDDTNPTTEDPDFVEAIAADIRWMGFEWEGEIRYASDYFEALYRLKRHGTTTLFAALIVATGKVVHQCMRRHRHQEFILNKLEATVERAWRST